MSIRHSLIAGMLVLCGFVTASAEDADKITILYLGDNGHHRPAERFAELQPVLAKRGIDLTYTDQVTDLNAKTLGAYDGLMIYANIEQISPEQEQALLDFVAGGKGFIPLHCASYCFLNSPKYIELVGAQFKRHGTGTFRATIDNADHPIMNKFGGFESWDETYVHDKHNEKDRTVLEYRADAEGREPWTWVRTHGKGRTFYTAWGHDQRTWSNPGFHKLVERGIRWSVGESLDDVPAFTDPDYFEIPKMTSIPPDVKPFEYVEATSKIPFYPPSQKWGTIGEPIQKLQLPLPAEESLKHMVVPEGFHVELFAAEPEIGKAITMNWDERGRLWICETVDYPNELQPPGQGRDRIRICEDTDNDGRADKYTIFAEQLSISTAIVCCRGGAVVQNGTETLFLKDTNGDDKADVRKVLMENWALGDTHGGVSNFRYGLDNWIWGMQGYNNSQPIVNGKQHPYAFRMGFFRFRLDDKDPPNVAELEFVRSTNNNTWGLGFSEEGLVFGSTANRNPSVYMPIANRYYERVRGWAPEQLGTIADSHLFKPINDKVRQVDHHGGYTAGAGHALYTARTYPQQYWNRTAFVCGPTGKLVGTFVLKRDGTDFHSTSPCNLLASNDEWTAPIMAEVGPDGNVWVIDWYNYVVQHNPTPQGFKTGKGNAYESELRDKKHGRIYRVVYGDAKSSRALDLSGASPDKLVASLTNDNMFWRLQGQRLLVERTNLDVRPALVKLTHDKSFDATTAMHALWTLHGLGALDDSNFEATMAALVAMSHPSSKVRRNAVTVMPRNSRSITIIQASNVLSDPDPHVRLAALLAMSELPADQVVGELIAATLAKPENLSDRWLPDAAVSAAAAHDFEFLKAVAAHKNSTPKQLGVIQIVSEHYARGAPVDSIGSLLIALENGNPQIAGSVIAGLSKGWPKGRKVELDNSQQKAIGSLLEKLPAESKGPLVKLASSWGAERFRSYIELVAQVHGITLADDTKSNDERISAARQMIDLQPDNTAVVVDLLKQITPRTSPELSGALIDSLGASESDAVGSELIGRVASFTPTAKSAALRVMLSRPNWTVALLDGIEKRKLQLADLSLDQKQTLSSHPDKQLAAHARKLIELGGGLPNPDRQKVLEELLPLTKQSGDVAAGLEVYKKQCAKCHVHGSEGTRIGPDLTGMAVHPKHELLTHLIDPSRSVEGNFRVYSVTLLDGRVMNGLLAAETKTSIKLFDAEGKKHVVLREDIDELIASTMSLMPEGFEKQVKPEEIVNLLEFLTARGKFLPIPLAKSATIVSTQGMFFSKDAGAERLIFPDWKPKEFEGVPFHLVDPQGERVANVIMLNGPQGQFPPQMPKSVSLPCNAPAKAIHFLSGVSGWGYPAHRAKSVSMIVRLHFADGEQEDHELRNAVHFADYIRRVDVSESKLAFMLRGQQIRYLAVFPKRTAEIKQIELVKGPDPTAPVVMAVTVESPE